MSIFGLGNDDDKKPVVKAPVKKADPKAKTGNQSDEAKQLLAKMEAKKDAGDCPFC